MYEKKSSAGAIREAARLRVLYGSARRCLLKGVFFPRALERNRIPHLDAVQRAKPLEYETQLLPYRPDLPIIYTSLEIVEVYI